MSEIISKWVGMQETSEKEQYVKNGQYMSNL